MKKQIITQEELENMTTWDRLKYKFSDWLDKHWLAFQEWRESWKPCPKEEQGYRCQHRILSDGKKECGEREERNYWKGDSE